MGLWFQKSRKLAWWKSTAASYRKLRVHIFKGKNEAERELELTGGCKFSTPPLMT